MATQTPGELEFDFALVLSGVTELDEILFDALYEAGCDDATLSLQHGVVVLDFSRSAASLKEAILGAIRDVRRSGLGVDVLRVDHCDRVNQAEIARQIGRTRSIVNQYINGKRGPGGFPPPISHITEGNPVWAWSDVAVWLGQNGIIKEQVATEACDVFLINLILEYQHRHQAHPELFDTISAELRTVIIPNIQR